MRALCVALALFSALANAAPLAEVWPYQAKRVEGGTEYAYDLSLVKAGNGTPDARAEHGDEAVAAYLKGLPREAKVFVKTGTSLLLSAGRGIEDAPLATSFTSSPDGPLASDDPLRRKVKSRMRAALDPDEPKILPGAEMVLWRVRRLEDGALAAAELDTDRLRKAWVSQLLARAQVRMHDSQGDIHEGALVLSARLGAALACLDASKLAVSADVTSEAKLQIEEMRKDAAALTPLGYYAWNAELQCAWRRTYVLAQPFPASRGGYAAPLILLSMLNDAKLKATWTKLKTRRDALTGGPSAEPLQTYLNLVNGDANKALDDLVTAIDAWGRTPPPPVLAAPRAPFEEFLSALQGPERAQAIDELFTAVGDGRIKLPTDANAPVEGLRQTALAALGSAEPPHGVQIDAVWRDQLQSAFCALQGAHHDQRDRDFERQPKDIVRTELDVVLEVPPAVDVEPAPDVYKREAAAAARLAAVLTTEGIGGVTDPEGSNGEGASGQLKHWAQVLNGLAVISTPGAGENADTAAARAFLNGWRADGTFAKDVRFAAAGPINFEDERAHAVIQGVARRELAVTFLDPPTVNIVGGVKGLTPDVKAEQRYIVPVLLTAGYRATASQTPLSYKDLRKAIDAAGRQPTQIPGAIADLSKAAQPSPQ
jgi:hypothetical protein